MRRCPGRLVVATLTCAVAGSTLVSARAPSLNTVLQRIERYVVAYEPELSALVARERYVQRSFRFRLVAERDQTSRTLLSDYLFLRLPGEDGPWLGFRDVLEVDGTPVADHAERLQEIVAASPDDARRRAMAMSRENARYNLGGFTRTLNVPLGVIAWMHPRLRDGFKFRHDGNDTIDGVSAWRIEFTERRRPTIVRTPLGEDVPSSGFVWVDPELGRVFRTELRNKLEALRVTIEVRFAHNNDFGLLAPARMIERYEDDLGGRIEAEAEYSQYRRFGVSSRIR
jgi:hypothetical protein